MRGIHIFPIIGLAQHAAAVVVRVMCDIPDMQQLADSLAYKVRSGLVPVVYRDAAEHIMITITFLMSA
eukprot:4441288-Prorocentrum_lima.AAC.1